MEKENAGGVRTGGDCANMREVDASIIPPLRIPAKGNAEVTNTAFEAQTCQHEHTIVLLLSPLMKEIG